jgi:hypothetical protein
MTRVTVDADLRKTLLDFSKPLELCDESGVVRAKLVPCPAEDTNEWIDLTAEISDEEIQKDIESGDEGYSTDELIAEIKRMRAM